MTAYEFGEVFESMSGKPGKMFSTKSELPSYSKLYFGQGFESNFNEISILESVLFLYRKGTILNGSAFSDLAHLAAIGLINFLSPGPIRIHSSSRTSILPCG